MHGMRPSVHNLAPPCLQVPRGVAVRVDSGDRSSHSLYLLGVVLRQSIIRGDQDPVVQLVVQLQKELRSELPRSPSAETLVASRPR